MTQDTDLREMVHSYGAALARRCADAVRSTSLSDGRLRDTTEIAGIEWHFGIVYDGDDDTVMIEAHPHPSDEATNPVAGLINVTTGAIVFGQQPNEDSFEFRLPAAWLPDVE